MKQGSITESVLASAYSLVSMMKGNKMTRNENSLGKWISVLHRCRNSYFNKQLEPYGISGGQFIILLALSRYNGLRQEAISDRLKIDKSIAAKSIKKLESNGYLTKEKDQSDGRAYNVFLTQKAIDIIPSIKKTEEYWKGGVTSGLTEKECQLVEKLLHKMADNARGICENG